MDPADPDPIQDLLHWTMLYLVPLLRQLIEVHENDEFYSWLKCTISSAYKLQ